MAEDQVHQSSPPTDGEQRWHEPGTVPLRPVVIVGAILLLCSVAYLGYSCARSSASGGSFTAPVSRYPTGTVTYIAPARTYLVRREDSSFLALSEVEDSASDRLAGCVIRYRADLSAAGVTGVFRDDCHATLFSRDGVAIQGSAPPMQQHPVRPGKDEVVVQITMCLGGGGLGLQEPCRE